MKKLKKKIKRKNKKSLGNVPLSILILIFVSAICLSLILRDNKAYTNWEENSWPNVNPFNSSQQEIKKFSSEEEFKDYLTQAENSMYGYGGIGMGRSDVIALDQEGINAPNISTEKSQESNSLAADERISSTNVQVAGIDEPDIVKTDGKEIYFSSDLYYTYRSTMVENIDGKLVPPNNEKINVIKAWPPSDLELDSSINNISGDMLLSGDTLVVFNGNNIKAFNISDPQNPSKKWKLKLENNSYLVTARLVDGQIYLVTASYLNRYKPCPIEPFSLNDEMVTIKCTDIYHPVTVSSVDTNFISMQIDAESGKMQNEVSFVGSSYSSVVYMSNQYLYITYNAYVDTFNLMVDFFKTKTRDLVPSDILARLDKLNSYDISQQAKLVDFSEILNEWRTSLDEDEQLRVENEMENRMTDYYKLHSRELQKSGIVKIGLQNLNIAAHGTVPGTPLNQFSLDEYNGNLRIATTINSNGGFFTSSGTSANDVYILDKNLNVQGSVLDLGLGERIYAVRFLNDRGYVVTFRQIDPFYVLNLSNPKNPTAEGELKIPGYSSYLHPVDEHKILGIGKEDNNVKISLFDVSNPANPSEIDKYSLDEYWSEILSNHHAFLMDSKHQIFFLPGSKGAYIFSYANNKLKLIKAISQRNIKRALYLNDYLYIIGTENITILDESAWEKVNELDLTEE